jgi:replicative DNA helicase
MGNANREIEELPHNLEVERAYLGAILVNGGAGVDPLKLLSPGDFHSRVNERIYRTVLEMVYAGEHIDEITVIEALNRKGELENLGGAAAVSALTVGVPFTTPSGLEAYTKIICDLAIRRRLTKSADALVQLAADQDFEYLAHHIDLLHQILEEREEREQDSSLKAIEKEYEEYVQSLDKRSIRIGIPPLDESIGGLQSGEVLTLLARTSVGKSAIGQNTIDYVLRHYAETGVIFFSVEMPRIQAFERHQQIFTGKTRDEIIFAYRTGTKSKIGADQFVPRFGDRLHIVDKAGITLPEIERRVRSLVALKRIKPVSLLLIDYLGMLGGGAKNTSTYERMSELARAVKELARRLNVAIVLLSQASRKAGDGSEEVTLTDARDSGAIEEAADFVLGAWRPELRSGIDLERFKSVRGEMWMKLVKARRGLQDKFLMKFDGKTLRIMGKEEFGTAYAN